MTDPMILLSRREHPQQSVDEDVEQLRGRDASLRYTCIKRDCCTFMFHIPEFKSISGSATTAQVVCNVEW